MAEDLPLALDLLARHSKSVPAEADGPAGIRIGLEAGLDGGGLLGLPRRWALAHTLAPVLAAAFANSPLDRGRPSGWRSLRQAARRELATLPSAAGPSRPPAGGIPGGPPTPTTGGKPGGPPTSLAGLDPRVSWTAYVMDAPVPGGRTLRQWARSANRPTAADLDRHLAALRPPVAARGHLELDFADRQPGAGWQVAVAVTTTLLDDPLAAAAAEAATEHFAYAKGVWLRAARDALTDPELAAAARECFLAAYAALARQGAARGLRDAVADFTERYVLRGRCPADDQLARAGTAS